VPLPAPDPSLVPHRGRYRSHDPWTPTFRILLRGDRLWLAFPDAPDGADTEQPLIPLGDGIFRLGEDESGPERAWFDLPIGGLTRRAWISGWPWYRVAD
jgi:D-alanyl-D-alanine carboxypeptidase